MCTKSRTVHAILLLCLAASSSSNANAHSHTPGAGDANAIESRQRGRRRRQQGLDGLLELDIEVEANWEAAEAEPEATPIIVTEDGHPAYTISKQQVTTASSSADATIRGKIYNDLNQNRLHGTSNNNEAEPPVQGAVAKLFSCSSGTRIGTTRTNSDGDYSFTIPSTSLPSPSTSSSGSSNNNNNDNDDKACFYIQYTVTNYILPNAVFTTPKNGETDDIYLAAGEVAEGVNVGVIGSTPAPTYKWNTPYPTFSPPASAPGSAGGAASQYAPLPGIGRTLSPTALALREEEGSESVGVPVSFEIVTPAPMGVIILALPTDTVPAPAASVPTPLLALPAESVPTPSVVASPAASPAVSSVVAEEEDQPSDGNDGAVENANVPPGDEGTEPEPELDQNNEQESAAAQVPGDVQESAGEGEASNNGEESGSGNQQDMPNNGDLIKPSDTYEEQKDKLDKQKKEDDSESIILRLKSTVRIHLAKLQTNMDDVSAALFEDVCAEFLEDQLEIATPPVYDLECTVVGQILDRGRILRSNDGGIVSNTNLRRVLAGSGLFLDVTVTGEVEKTKRVQEVDDVKFDALLMGTFNVQGYLFAEALQEAEREAAKQASTEETSEEEGVTSVEPIEASSPRYFAAVGAVQAIEVLGTAEAQGGENDTYSDSDEGILSNKGVLTAIVVGGVMALIVAFIAIKKARRTQAERKAAGASGGGSRKVSKQSVKSSGGARGAAPTSRRATESPANAAAATSISRPQTPKTPPRTTSPPKLAISPSADSDDIEIGLAITASQSASPVSQSASPRIQSTPPPSSIIPRYVPNIKPSSSSSPRTTPSPSPTKSSTARRTRRDIMTPAGKLGIMVANTTGHGPAVHTIRPGSPMEGLVHINDLIVAINDVDTRYCTAEQITQVMKDTVREERKITVLSKYSSRAPDEMVVDV